MSYSNKLQNIIAENTAHMIFMDEIINADIDEDAIVTEISGAGPLHGMQYLGYDEGVLSFSTYQKSAVESFATFLDDSEYVETYGISVMESNPLTKSAHILPEIDFDSTRESEFIENFIDVVINFQYVNFNDVYIDNEHNAETEMSFAYPTSEIDNSLEFYDTPEMGELPSTETPLLVKLSKVTSHAPDGNILVTVHPKNDTQILVQVVYENGPLQLDNLLLDLDTINNLDSVYKSINLVTEAYYTDGSTSTTSAIYETVEGTAAFNIMESIGTIESCDINLLCELKRVYKVNYRGKKRIKMVCAPGFKYDAERMACIKISGAELANSRIAHRQMARTKKALGGSFRTRVLRKVRRAKRFRKMMGL